MVVYGDHKIPIAGIRLGVIGSDVNQIADLNGNGRMRTAARGFGSLTSRMVTELQGVLVCQTTWRSEKEICAWVN